MPKSLAGISTYHDIETTSHTPHSHSKEDNKVTINKQLKAKRLTKIRGNQAIERRRTFEAQSEAHLASNSPIIVGRMLVVVVA